ncbi:PTS lactose/cellobiose transporter subunit IIA [uncultured Dubosiella sp.]|uniref:PTS lactose/cellobiose transporter subunit IIA n=1 Tax=uncultured Dubosiella sp. TaxID=1937011 RepID=UPI000EED5313|nr:PTS lactose/cellobiose transporter subunit IIA [uncultured Dubosiella sp.]GJM58902.1 lichenan-specific phosphotransferase enzyme IIA component [Erysipelotrichaceae bacterium OPF54]HAM30503.1 PTS lactose/cellobiose transporter subunit IIA [Erysipelotrichaceae bacterium]
MNEEIASLAMNLIFSSGNAKSTAIQAIRKAEEDMPEAKKLLKEAQSQLHEGHAIQTRLMQDEINGKDVEKSILLIHAQDHFMAADTVILLAKQMMKLYERLEHNEAV